MDWLTAGLDLTNNIGSGLINIIRDRASRDWQEEMWNRQNEYNLPVNQRQRLEEAEEPKARLGLIPASSSLCS